MLTYRLVYSWVDVLFAHARQTTAYQGKLL